MKQYALLKLLKSWTKGELQTPHSPLLILGDGFGVVGHKHIVRPFQGSEDQCVHWVFLHILQTCLLHLSISNRTKQSPGKPN